MANLQDVPLADTEGLPMPDSDEAPGSKTSSLKRFFKLGRKPALKDPEEKASQISFEGDNRELGKSNTLSRFFARKKAPPKDGLEQSNSAEIPIEQDKPLPNPKTALKSSMSTYWKRLFHLHKTQNQDAASEQEKSAGNEPEEVHELQSTDDLEQPDLDKNQEPQPETVSEPEPLKTKSKKSISEEPFLSTLKSGHRLIVEQKDVASDQS